MKKNFFLFAFVLLVFISFTSQAYALAIYPDLEEYNGTMDPDSSSDPVWASNSQSEINNVLAGLGIVNELYKDEISGEEGPLKDSYATSWDGTSGNESGATITYTGGPTITDAWLLVKDGNNSPWWYLFDLRMDGAGSGLDWTGTETLELSSFWPGNGAISHVALYGSNPVPEPTTMLLFGIGLIGLAGLGRNRKKN